jgi:bis(5'-nucleosidyl)-tetraphosphatase
MMKKEYSAGVVIFLDHHEERMYLLLHYASGHWDFAKGHIEGEETKQHAALREVAEETGISTIRLVEGFEESLSYYHRYPQTKELSFKTVYFFLGQAYTSTIMLSHEHIGFAWLPFKEAVATLTYDNAKKILIKAERFLIKNLE